MGNTQSISTFVLISRVPDSVILSVMVFIVGIFYGDLFSGVAEYLLMAVSLFLVIYGIYVGNSYFDRAECGGEGLCPCQRDAIILKATFIVPIFSGLLICLYFGALAFLFALSCTVLFLLYNVWLKKILLVKDLIVGFGFTIPPV